MRPPAKEQLTEVPGSWPRWGNTEGEAFRQNGGCRTGSGEGTYTENGNADAHLYKHIRICVCVWA